MAKDPHIDQIRDVKPSSKGCEDCLKMGGRWLHLRLCLTCGHVGCCDSSPKVPSWRTSTLWPPSRPSTRWTRTSRETTTSAREAG